MKREVQKKENQIEREMKRKQTAQKFKKKTTLICSVKYLLSSKTICEHVLRDMPSHKLCKLE